MGNPWPVTRDPTLNYLSLFVVTRPMRTCCMKRRARWLSTRMGLSSLWMQPWSWDKSWF
jgi:hypothetical protein